jgi:hypothetical protein
VEDQETADEPEETAKPTYAYTTDEPAAEQQGDDDNPLAAALRKAMQGH